MSDGKCSERTKPGQKKLSDAAYRASIDPGPRRRQQHDALVLESMPREDGIGLRVRVTTQRPLDRYLMRGEITPDQHVAGDRLRADFERAGLQPRVTMHYAPRLPATSSEPGDHRLDARRRLYAAIDGVGRLGKGVLWHVCCVGESAGDWAHRHGRGTRDGIVLLRAALAELDRFYRLPQAASRNAAGRRSKMRFLSDDEAAAARRLRPGPAAPTAVAARQPVR